MKRKRVREQGSAETGFLFSRDMDFKNGFTGKSFDKTRFRQGCSEQRKKVDCPGEVFTDKDRRGFSKEHGISFWTVIWTLDEKDKNRSSESINFRDQK